MRHKTAKIMRIRERFGIPKEGLSTEQEAWDWYSEHFKTTKGSDFTGRFGFCYKPFQRGLEFDYQWSPNGFFISSPSPLDSNVPFDRAISSLAKKLALPEWAAPALRLVVLIGKLSDELILNIPYRLMAPLGQYRLLIQPVKGLSLRQWRRLGEQLGFLPSEDKLWSVPGIIQVYAEEKKSKKRELYWQTLMAYIDVVGIRREQGRKGKRGINQDTAKRLVGQYDWEYEPDSYTVKRYLDRAKKRWNIQYEL